MKLPKVKKYILQIFRGCQNSGIKYDIKKYNYIANDINMSL